MSAKVRFILYLKQILLFDRYSLNWNSIKNRLLFCTLNNLTVASYG